MPNYSLGKIYKLIDNTCSNVYYGSTTEPTLARRLSGHVSNYKTYIKGKGNYITSFDIIKNNTVNPSLVLTIFDILPNNPSDIFAIGFDIIKYYILIFIK